MPLGIAMAFFDKCDINVFMDKGTLEVDTSAFGDSQRVYRLQSKWNRYVGATMMHMFGQTTTTKTIEFGFDFHKEMRRIQLNCLAGRGETVEQRQARCKKYIAALREALLCEKRRQMQIPNAHSECNVPWEVENVWTMPVVFWINKCPTAGV